MNQSSPAEPAITRQCTAKISDGSRRCRKPAMRGQRTCRSHGGAPEHSKRAAKRRLSELVEPAITALSAALERVEADRRIALHPSIIKAAQLVLDRCGYAPGVKVEVEDNRQSRAWAEWTTPAERKTLMKIMQAATKRMEAGGDPPGRPKPRPAPEPELEDEVTL